MTNNPEFSEPNRQNLRAEYEVCQQVANNATSGYWAFAGIFLAFSSVILAGVFTMLFQWKHLPLLAFIDTFLCLGMWIIYFALWQMSERANYTQRIAFDRMRDIERMLQNMKLRRNLDSGGIGIRGKGASWYGLILLTLSALWLIGLITIWVIAIMPFVCW